jgi:hypothetical protein
MDLITAEKFLRTTLSKTKYRAREERGLDFDIDIYDVMDLLKKQKGRCALTGQELEFTRGGSFGYGTNPNACTIDRIYNTAGYVRWNIQLACWKPNKIKAELSNREFYEMARNVVKTIKIDWK